MKNRLTCKFKEWGIWHGHQGLLIDTLMAEDLWNYLCVTKIRINNSGQYINLWPMG